MRRSTGCLRLACGTTGGRNCLANLARIAALTVVRLNLLEFSISLDRLRRSARRFHAPVDLSWPGLVDSSISFLTARFVKCRANAKERTAQSAHFQRLGNCREFTYRFMAGKLVRLLPYPHCERIGPV